MCRSRIAAVAPFLGTFASSQRLLPEETTTDPLLREANAKLGSFWAHILDMQKRWCDGSQLCERAVIARHLRGVYRIETGMQGAKVLDARRPDKFTKSMRKLRGWAGECR
jgi:hypothetical protein